MYISVIYESRFLRNIKKNKIKYSEEFAKEILKDEELTKKTVFILGNLLMLEKVVYANPSIDKAGGILLGLVQNFGYWVCLIMCAVEVIRTLMQGDTKSIGKVVAKYVTGFATFYFLPWLFDIIKTCFK